MKIKLGPLLGLEADYKYTVCFLSEHEIKKNSLTLELSRNDTNEILKYEYESCTRLQSHYFYRFSFDLPKANSAYKYRYSLNLNGNGLADPHNRISWEFEVPGRDKMPKIGFCSCNGNSNKYPSEIPKRDFIMWKHMKANHLNSDEPFHLLLLGGDQIYADSIWDNVASIDGLKVKSKLTTDTVVKKKFNSREEEQLTKELKEFYEGLYIDSWKDVDMSYMLASVPSVAMWDDHDIFDGWGSYPRRLQNSDLFKAIFPVAKHYFEVIQLRTSANNSRVSKRHFSLHFSFRNLEIIALDNRTFRTTHRIMAPTQYNDLEKVLKRDLFKNIPSAIAKERVLCFVVPVPVAHLNYSRFIQKYLPKVAPQDFLSSFNDDATDHWDHQNHKSEQKEFLDILFDAGKKHNAKYVCLISGDVHTAGAATIINRTSKSRITQLVSSGIVHNGPKKWQEYFLKLLTSPKSSVADYALDLKNFGNFKKKAINIRNFGILSKVEKGGVVASLGLEGRENLAHRTLNLFKGGRTAKP